MIFLVTAVGGFDEVETGSLCGELSRVFLFFFGRDVKKRVASFENSMKNCKKKRGAPCIVFLAT